VSAFHIQNGTTYQCCASDCKRDLECDMLHSSRSRRKTDTSVDVDDIDDKCDRSLSLPDTVFKIENKQYGHAPIRSDTSIRVYTTANTDTDTSTPCVSVPATYIITPGRSLRERSLYAMGGTLHQRLNNADH